MSRRRSPMVLSMIQRRPEALLRSHGRASVLALIVAAGLGGPALAQEAPATEPQAGEIQLPQATPEAAPATVAVSQAGQVGVANRILVQGNQRIDQTTILSYLPIQPGDPVDPVLLDVAVRTLYRTNLFADVQMALDGTDLVVQVVENPVINQVVFEGHSAISEEKLREEVTIRPRGVYTPSRVQEDVQSIVELYRLSGRISATVTPKLIQLEQNRVDLVFEIDEGVSTGVRGINFLGNEAFSDSDLRGVMVTKTSRWWRLFSSNDNYDPNRLDYDQEQLRTFYTNRGYYDFRVVSAVAELSPSQDDFLVTMTIDEGEQYNFGEITVETESDRLNPEFLRRLLPLQEGDLYESDRIEESVDALTFAAGSAGYAFVDIRPTYRADPETRTVNVTFNVREGDRVYVDRIDIVGNTRTIDPVIRREMMLVEGDAFNRTLIERSRNNLRALGFFENVEITEAQGDEPDRSVVTVQVTEQPTGELSVGAGFSSVDAFIINLGISERNFRGRGQNVVARLEWGSIRQQIDFRFTEPKFLGRDIRAGWDLYHSRYDYSEYSSYSYASTGGGFRFSWPINGYTLLSTRYSLRSDEVTVPSGYCGTGGFGSRALCEQIGDSLNSSIGYTLLVDRRNDPVRPTRGWSGNLRQDFAGVGGDVNYVRSEVEGSWYYGFSPAWVVSLQGSSGYISGWNGDAIRINDRFFKGGNSFRGFETAGIGPRDLLLGTSSQGNALGGNFYAIGTVELTVPNYLPEEYGIRTSLFMDVGTLGVLDDRYQLQDNGTLDPNIVDELSLRASAGLSVHWRSPMGPIRLDFSKVLAKEDYDVTETFRFSTSTQF